ncbi:MAG: hypothetical protein ACJ798_08655 [Phenylobacterium sp.]
MLIALIAGIVLAQATPATSPPETPTSPAPASAAPAKPAKPKMICHDEIVTGSIMTRRVCRTPEQVEADRQQARRDTDALGDHLAACRGPSC